MESIEEIRSALAQVAASAAPRQRRYPAELKAATVAYARRERKNGRSMASVARELDLTGETIRHWLGERGRASGRRLRPVTVTPDRRPPQQVAVVTAAGHRVEPLTLAEAAELLRALG